MNLTFTDFKLLDEMVKERWDGQGYRAGHTDERIAKDAADMLQKPVSVGEVAQVRKANGYEIRVPYDETQPEEDVTLEDIRRRVVRIEAKLHALAGGLGVSLERK